MGFVNATTPLAEDSPLRWLGTSTLLNLRDDRLRLRAQSLVQLAQSDHERLLILHEFVKAMPYCAPGSQGHPTARQVLDARQGDAFGKSTLLVALLRLARIPARMRFVQLPGEVLRGLAGGLKTVAHPVVEVWLGERWLKTDTHVYDIHYLVSAREKLRVAGWAMGYGIHSHAHSIWNGREDAFAAFAPNQPGGKPLADLGVFDDPRRFRRAMKAKGRSTNWLGTRVSAMRWAMAVRAMARGVRKLRLEIAASVARPLSEPVRISPDSQG